MRLIRNAVATVMVVGCLTACGKDSTSPAVNVGPGTGTAVNLKGTLASVTLSGDIDITIAANASNGLAPITGCVYLKTATCVTATGNYTLATKALSFSTASPAIVFTGSYADGVVNGTFTHSAGAGIFTTRSGSVTVYCGTFSGNASGRWNFTITGSTLDGVYNDGSSSNRLAGTVSGSNLSITFAAGTAAGTLSGSSASGTWTAGSASGTWAGTNAGCRS
jgi:hypothetical protein